MEKPIDVMMPIKVLSTKLIMSGPRSASHLMQLKLPGAILIARQSCRYGRKGQDMKSVVAMSDADDSTSKGEREHRASPIDAHVGSRVRLRRTLLGMSQEKLGDALGLTFQQVQKYERGVNRIGASRLFDLARVLDVPIGFFFDDLPPEMGGNAAVRSHPAMFGFAEAPAGFEDESMNKRETLELVRAFSRITEPGVRKRVFELIKSLAPTE
jgi:transcriptional regulator with XRE-family HTH domain